MFKDIITEEDCQKLIDLEKKFKNKKIRDIEEVEESTDVVDEIDALLSLFESTQLALKAPLETTPKKRGRPRKEDSNTNSSIGVVSKKSNREKSLKKVNNYLSNRKKEKEDRVLKGNKIISKAKEHAANVREKEKINAPAKLRSIVQKKIEAQKKRGLPTQDKKEVVQPKKKSFLDKVKDKTSKLFSGKKTEKVEKPNYDKLDIKQHNDLLRKGDKNYMKHLDSKNDKNHWTNKSIYKESLLESIEHFVILLEEGTISNSQATYEIRKKIEQMQPIDKKRAERFNKEKKKNLDLKESVEEITEILNMLKSKEKPKVKSEADILKDHKDIYKSLKSVADNIKKYKEIKKED